mgnify:FL=1
MKHLESLAKIFSAFDDAIYIVDKNRKIVYFNQAAENLTGFKAEEIIGKHCYDNVLNHVDELGTKLCINGCPLLDSIKNNIVNDSKIYLHHKDGYRVPINVKTIPYVIDNEVLGAIEVFNSLSKLVINEQYVADCLTLIDPLTGLLNRYFLKNNLKDILKNNNNYALLFLDIDNFKSVNDQYGHLYGDEILKIIANTIIANIGPTDYPIRFGGDEILILLNVENSNQAKEKALSLMTLINSSEERFKKYRPNVTIGVKKNESINDAIERADKAMYEGKKCGKNCVILI